jgi:choline-sulfatase
MNKPDILVFFSDQHNANVAGFAGDTVVRTPNLDGLSRDGVVFREAYTSCPLCVPARTSFLTGQLPSRTGVFDNDSTFSGDQATFIHSLAAEGYETVLCGRMHFMGENQRHGFTKRIMGEFTPLFPGRAGDQWKDLGPYTWTTNVNHCLEIIGGGNSPVLEYDRSVLKAALDYLAERHEKPQCLVVGTYGPHFPYVSPPDLYQYYRESVTLPCSLESDLNYDHPVISWKEQRASHDTILKARAAYYGMIENLDHQAGLIREAWIKYLEKGKRGGVFVYLSDHGDQIGERYLFGKQTYFEGSARIPLIFEGSGIEKNGSIGGAVSIMDIGATLCELTGAAAPPDQDGMSLMSQLTEKKANNDRSVLSEYIDRQKNGQLTLSRMLRRGRFKYITYSSHEDKDLLFDMEKDPYELHNIIEEDRETAEELKRRIEEDWDRDRIVSNYEEKLRHQGILDRWGKVAGVDEIERWPIPATACRRPRIV